MSEDECLAHTPICDRLLLFVLGCRDVLTCADVNEEYQSLGNNNLRYSVPN
jgi:hypothetical protein